MNAVLKELGFGPNDRVAIVHADDFGMCQATIPAIGDLFTAGLVSAASVMVPCPWFASAAAVCRAHSEFDVGVHTTLTCEWDAYRWAALTTSDAATNLVDQEGFLPRTTELVAKANPQAVARELAAQLERALAAGIDVTHIDSHMGAAFQPNFVLDYLALAANNQIPAMLPRMQAEQLKGYGFVGERAMAFLSQRDALEARGMALVDNIVGMPLDQYTDRLAVAKRVFDGLPAGLSYVILHPAADTPELRAIAPDWRARVADYETFMGNELRSYVRDTGVQTIGYRMVRDHMQH